jgi:hypothetical protein
MNMETQKADIAIAKERARGGLEIVLRFEIDGFETMTELDQGETATTVFPGGFDRFISVESDKDRWVALSDTLDFTK